MLFNIGNKLILNKIFTSKQTSIFSDNITQSTLTSVCWTLYVYNYIQYTIIHTYTDVKLTIRL